MADPLPTEVVLNMSLRLERADPEDDLTCWFCHGHKCEWDTVYKIGGQSIGVGVHERCREAIAKRHPVKEIQKLFKELVEARQIIKLALDEWHEADWTDRAYDFLGRSRRKSAHELETEVKALKARIEDLQSGQVEAAGSDQSES